MAEGRNPATGYAWGCVNSPGWVPFPKEIPRRHPLLDAVGRTDDPCARPAYHPPDYRPEPKFKPPREGYPNAVCDINKYKNKTDFGPREPGPVTVTVQSGDPQTLRLQVQPCGVYPTEEKESSEQQCCDEARSLDLMCDKVNEIIGPQEEVEAGMRRWQKCQSACEPLLPKYPCRGVISLPSKGWRMITEKEMCGLTSSKKSSDDTSQNYTPITGKEFVEGKRTSDFYRVDCDLPSRFDNPEWFQGYGAERPEHPFYIKTSSDYGRFPPTAHTMTVTFHPKNCKFTSLLGKTGMFRNRSLNFSSSLC